MTTVVVDYWVGRALAVVDVPRHRRVLLIASLATSLGMLAFFKYYGFFIESLDELAANFGLDLGSVYLDLILPIGISFYTFHTMSYVIDVYTGRSRACRSFVDFALFVTFFPQLVAGPIARAHALLPQIQATRRITPEHVSAGLFLVLIGYIEKVVIADGAAAIVDRVFADDQAHVGLDMLLAIYAFSFQILGDFMGYTDIARGLARMMGIELALNFNLPYFSKSPSDFWRRWHISLSKWLRDYLYIPLGGSRAGRLATYRNLMITMLLGGLWHGAAWTMVIWGGFHGVALAINRWVSGSRIRPEQSPAWVTTAQILMMFHLVSLGWLIFRAKDMEQVGRFLTGIASGFAPTEASGSYAALLIFLAVPFLGFQLLQFRAGELDIFSRWNYSQRSVFLVCALGFVGTFLVVHRSLLHLSAPFIYFQF